MSQQRFFNFKEDDKTSLLIRWLTGLHPGGRYFGYDFNPTADLTLSLLHTTSGFKYVDNTLVESGFLSMVLTRQGTTIIEDAAVNIAGISAGDATNPRIDLIILTHTRLESAGGTQALYSVIEGTPAASPVAPALSNPLTQTIIGELYIPANTTQLNDVGVVWTQAKRPTFANGSPLDDITLGANLVVQTDADGALEVSAVTSTELGYLAGATSSIQNQINGKEPTITGAATTITSADLTADRALISNGAGKVAISAVTSTELGYVAGVSSAIQTQINGKQATITGAATSITAANLTANRALISDGSGKVAVHGTVSDTELGYLNGATSAIQTQIDTINTNLGGIKRQVFDIGDWDMDTNATLVLTDPVSIPAADIRSMEVTIRTDTGLTEMAYFPIDYSEAGNAFWDDGGAAINVRIQLSRVAADWFDSTNYNATTYNRGWITIWHV